MSLQDLPLDILLEIARSHPWVGCELSKTIRKVGLVSIELDSKKWFKMEENQGDTKETFILVKSSKDPYYEKSRHSWDDKPAKIFPIGTCIKQMWYKEGMIHRDNDLPATIYSDGVQWWYKEGKLHRDNDKPAITFLDGAKMWYKDGDRYFPESYNLLYEPYSQMNE